MRFPEPNEDITGKVCICSVGRVAVVAGKKYFDFAGKNLWYGIGLDGKGNWASSTPVITAESVEEFHDRLATRFGGKMTFNG